MSKAETDDVLPEFRTAKPRAAFSNWQSPVRWQLRTKFLVATHGVVCVARPASLLSLSYALLTLLPSPTARRNLISLVDNLISLVDKVSKH